MKTPTFLALAVLGTALTLPAAAQSGHGSSNANKVEQSAPPAGEQQRASADPSAPATDAGGVAPADASGPRDDFARADTDRDGRISAKEYAASDVAALDMIAAGKRDGTEAPRGGFNLANNEGRPDRSKFFRQLDADKDGYLSRAEFLEGSRQQVKNRP